MSTAYSANVEKLKAKLDEWNAEIDKLEARARAQGADAKASYDKALSDLRDRQAEAKSKLNALQ
jgi:hypothetical protein